MAKNIRHDELPKIYCFALIATAKVSKIIKVSYYWILVMTSAVVTFFTIILTKEK